MIILYLAGTSNPCYTVLIMILAIDTGGTKTLIARFDRNGHKTVLTRFATPQDFSQYVTALRTALAETELSPTDIDAVVVAMPGTIEYGKVVRLGNLPWHNVDIVAEIKQFLGEGVPVFVENDAHLGALGEVRPRKDIARRSIYLTVSTGINGGLVIDGQLSHELISAELGHIQLSYDGRLQRWEDFASGRAILATYGKQASDIDDEATWREISKRLSHGLAVILPILRPDIVIIGGGVGTHFAKFSKYLNEQLSEIVPEHYRCPIVEATHPEEAVLYGCYYYAVDALAS